MGLENHQDIQGKLVIESDHTSVYGHVEYDDRKYPFQIVYDTSEEKSRDKSTYISFDMPTPYEEEWIITLTGMIIDQKLL